MKQLPKFFSFFKRLAPIGALSSFITTCESKQYGFHLVHHPEKKHMPSPGFEPGSPRPQSKSDDLDRTAMGPASY